MASSLTNAEIHPDVLSEKKAELEDVESSILSKKTAKEKFPPTSKKVPSLY
jgi:hypothetical protein